MNALHRLAVIALFAVSGAASAASGGEALQPGQVRVEDVRVVMSQVGPIVLLKVREKAIPIFVDVIVAESIQGALGGPKPPRPLTHDLVHTILEAYDGKVVQVVITLKDQTFYGALTIALQNSTKVFDSRSSDAIALAIHFNAPILVSQELVDKVGVELEKKPGEVKL